MKLPPPASKPLVYLDHGATTPLDPQAAEAMLPYLRGGCGNPSSLHRPGREARLALENARSCLAGLLNARESEIYFVSGGTEADNLAIQGAAFKNRHKGQHIITTAVEHPAVLNTCKYLEKQGFEVAYLAVDEYGQVDPETVRSAIRRDTILLSVMHGNNEVGTLNPLAEIGKIAREAGVYFHSDAVQSFGKIPLDVQALPVDLLSISGHKIYGPGGIGALYIRRGVALEKLLHGGRQEGDKRAGTENLPGVIGLAKAAELICRSREEQSRRVGELRDYFQEQLLRQFPGIRVNGHPQERLYNNLNVSFPGCDSETLLLSLDMQGIAASSGSACSAGSIEPSRVLKAMGLPAAISRSAIRFTLGKDNTREEIDYVLESLREIVPRLQNIIQKV